MKLIIEDDEGRKSVVQFGGEEITIGRQDGNTVQLPDRNVSRRHARLLREDGILVIEDLGSYNGVHVNGDRITGRAKVKEGDLIEIGDYDLGIEGKVEAVTPPPQVQHAPTRSRPVTMPPQAAPKPAPQPEPAAPKMAPAAGPSGLGGATAIIRLSDLANAAPEVEARDLAKSEMPRLVGLSGSIRGKEFYLMRTEVKVGRSEDNDIAIDHPSMSRQHARFVLDGGEWKVIDNKSANGVHVNGEPYAISAVRPGDTIELGHLKLRFCAPGEKFTLPSEAKEDSRPGLRPTTAELIAGARAEAPVRPAPKKKKLPLGAIAVVAAIVGGGAAFLLLRNRGPSAAVREALQQGDAAFKRHDYLAAMELYEEAATNGEQSPNMRKAAEEAKAQETSRQLDKAIAANDFERARIVAEKCASDSSYWCRKVQERSDAVRQGYARLHLAKARGARPETCRAETQLVLQFDPGNAEAQSVAAQCSPAPAPAVQREPAKPRGPSQKERDAKAKELIAEANSLSTAKDYASAIAKYQAALELKPSGQYAGLAYRGLGTAAAYQSDTKAAVKWFKLYLPYAPDEATKTQVTQLIQRFGG
jgi:pSer/pThr/pTyr-binding forkhead associated (FHA) protein